MASLLATGTVAVGIALSGAAHLDDLPFVKADNSPLAQAISTQFVQQMAPSVRGDYEWARTDIDGDGYDELFIRLLAPSVCAANGCPIIGYRRVVDGSWRPILTAVGNKVAISSTPSGATELVVDPGRDTVTKYVFDEAADAMVPLGPTS